MTTLKERALKYLKDRKKKIDEGGINTIPSPFKRFSNDFIGIEQGKMYIVTGQTKSAKSQITSFIFVYNTLVYAYLYPEQIRLKIFYYALEETPEDILYRFISYLLYVKSNNTITISPEDLKSSKIDKPVPQEILDLLETEEYDKMITWFEDHVIFNPSKNPTGVFNEVKTFMKGNGTEHTKTCKVKDELGRTKEVEGFDYYEPNDPDLYTIVVIDHISLKTRRPK